MAVQGDWCPKCGQPQYVNGVCYNDDCNYPAYKSNNETKREEAAAREARDAELRGKNVRTPERKPDPKPGRTPEKTQTGQKSKAPKRSDADIDQFGRVLALIGGGAAGIYFYQLRPDEPVAYLMPALVSAAVLYLLRKLIVAMIGLAIVAGVVWLLLQSAEKSKGPVPSAAATAALPAPTVHELSAYGICLWNKTSQDVQYILSWNGIPRPAYILAANRSVVDWKGVQAKSDQPPQSIIEFSNGTKRYRLSAAVRTYPAGTWDEYSKRIACKDYPQYEFIRVGTATDLVGPK